MVKQLLRRPLRAVGFDIVRWSSLRRPLAITYPSTLWLEEYQVRTILDIGASEGDFALTMSHRFPAATVYSFEPLAKPFSILREKISTAPQCKAFNFALGDIETEMEMHRSSYSPSSSILPMAELHRAAFPIAAVNSGTEKIRTRRLDDVAGELDLKDDLFVKIDVQGFEAHVIRGGSKTLSRAKVLIVEMSFQTLYEGQPLFDDVYNLLKQLGFSYAGNWDQLVDPRNDRVLQVDGIFRRGPMTTPK